MVFGLIFPTILSAAEFNPNYIISDDEMQNWKSMDRSDIQAFLDDKNSYLSDYRSDDWEGTRRLSSDIIYRAAQENEINPKYLLVKLQKEQSLITDQDPSEKRLDWATGYGVCDSCKMTDPDIQKYKGFGTQVDRAAGIMRWYYENMKKESWIKRAGVTYTIDDEKVTPQSDATGFLYSYTPHIQGNKNFWKLWQAWFDQVYPNSTLMQVNGAHEIYLIKNGTKRKFKNMTSLITRYNPDMIVYVSPSELTRYEDGPDISLPNYSIVKQNAQYYLIDYDYIRQFESYEVVKKLGYHPDEIIDVTKDDLDGYIAGTKITADIKSPLGRVVRVKESDALYYITDEYYHPIYDASVAKNNYPHLTIELVLATDLYNLKKSPAILPTEGTLFGIIGDPKIYVVENNKKRHIATATIFEEYGYNWNNIIWVENATGDAIKTGQALYEKPSIQSFLPPDTTPLVLEQEENNDAIEIIYTTIKEEDDLSPHEYLVKTPADKVHYVGPKFDTETDTYLVAEYDTGNILAGKNIDTVRPMASLTKVMTAYQLFLDNIDLDETITYDETKHESAYHRFRIQNGEQISADNLMYSMLVSSKNTASRMLVNMHEAQDSQFVARMEETAQNLGLNHMNFADTSGFDTDNQSTAREYMKLFSQAVQHTDIKTYLSTKKYKYTELLDKDGITTHSGMHSNALVHEPHESFDILASKTGFLYDAGTCLVMLIERKNDNKKFIVITMGNPEFTTSKQFETPKNLTNWALKNF